MPREHAAERILVAEDDVRVRETVTTILRAEGFAVEAVDRGPAALEALAGPSPPAAAILDLGLPGMDGLEVTRRLRATGSPVPILVLTARAAVDDRVDGLEAGADDYVTKPFELRELVARLRALLRRVERGSAVRAYGDLRLDAFQHVLVRGERQVALTRTETSLLGVLLDHREQVVTRSQLYEAVWGYDFGPSSNTLGVFIGYLRRKTEAGGAPRLIHTVRGVGYVLRSEPPA